MTTQPQKKDRRNPWQTFSLLSIMGAIALLLLLVVALLLPDGTISALTGKAASMAAPAAAPQYVTSVLDDTQPATATLTTTLETEEVVEWRLDQLPTVSGCTGCMHIWIIDRYEKTGVGGGWRMTITYPDGSTKTFLVPAGGDFYVPTWNPPPGICAGTYKIALEVPTGWEPITPATVEATLTGTEGKGKCAQIRFKVGLLPILKVTKLDQNGPNGVPAGIPDWKMTVTDNAGIVLVGSTDGLGEVYFALPHLGNWVVTEEVKVGWQPVSPALPSVALVIDPPVPPAPPTGSPWIVPVVFVNKQIRDGCIEIIKRDSTGQLLNDWNVLVRRDDGTFPDRAGLTGTAGAGRALITGLPMGDYSVTETVKPWWRPDKTIGASQPATLKTPGPCVTITFVNEPLGCIDGYKIDYLNRGLENWEITVTNQQTGDAFAMLTNAAGYFQFVDLPFGTYTVKEKVKERWSPVTADSQQVVLAQQGPDCVPVRFKNIRDSACLEVYKGDVNDPNPASPIGYTGVAGIKITLQPAFGGTPIDMVTDGTGRVFFDHLTPGWYIVAETLTDPWVAYAGPGLMPFELGASEPCRPLGWTTPVVFLNRQKTMAPPKKDPPPPKSTPTSTGGGCRAWYTVRAGNTLYSIAVRYGSTVNRLVRANHICNANFIYVGQKLCIP